jgi:hypothetical protein
MPREGRANRKLRRLGVAGLADQNHIGILAEQRPQRGGKGEADLFADLRLPDAGELVFDRVFQRVDRAVAVVQQVQRGMERGGLARTGRSGEVDESGRAGEGRVQGLGLGGREPQGGKRLVPVNDNDLRPINDSYSSPRKR